MEQLPSRLVEQAVNELASLPGIGKRTALRLALHLLKRDAAEVDALGQALIRMRKEVQFCKSCHSLSDKELCEICANPSRDKKVICVVEDVRDVMAIENTHQFKGIYHVLGGVINPIEGIGPADLTIELLVQKVETESVQEIIMALPATIEGDTTNFYIYRRLKDFQVELSTIARGISVGDELEYADEITLGRSIVNRTPFEQSLNR